MTLDPKHRSHIITDGPERAGARAMLKAIGFTDDDLARPIIGVANTWIETMPCNYHLRRLAVKVKEGIRAAGGTPMEFNTISISDGVTMGTEGMKASSSAASSSPTPSSWLGVVTCLTAWLPWWDVTKPYRVPPWPWSG